MKHSDYLKKKKTRETRKKIISVISAIVVFITTYALVLPAITLDVSRASREPGIAYEQMQFKATASAASVTAADSTVEEAQVEEPAAEEAAEEETIKEEAAEIPEEETSAVSDENEKEEAEQVVEEAPAESAREEAPAAEAEEVQEEEDKSAEGKADAEPSSEPAQEEAQTAETQKSADQAAVDQSGKSGTQATEAAAAASTEETAAEFQIPTLDPIDFDEILTGKTDFYFYHVEKTEEDENITSDSVDDWKKVSSDTVLAPEDFVRVYLSYEIPAGSLNETNAEARYRLPAGLELSDKQIKDINKYENGIAASKYGSEHDKYLGAEAIEGGRTPDEKAGDEYISATVKVEKTNDGGQDLIFTFIPYTVEKNQISYDEAGKLASEGRNVKGFFTFDLTTAQIDFEKTEKETVEKEDGTAEEIQYSKAEVVFVKENNDRNIDEISRTLTLAAPVEKEEPKALTSEGSDYTVTVSYTEAAQIPDNAELAVREIEKGTEEYASYLEQAKGAVDEHKSVNEARFFDITILVDGEKVEPQAPVNVQITFTGIEQTNTDDTQLLHYKDDKEVEIMDKAEFSKSEESQDEAKAVDTVQFEADGFSVYGIVGVETLETTLTTSDGESYRISVNYTKEADIPNGSELVVREILRGTSEYDDYRAKTQEALGTSDVPIAEIESDKDASAEEADSEEADAAAEEVDSERTDEGDGASNTVTYQVAGNAQSGLTFIRFFDISIMHGEEEIEPKAPVEVVITYMEPMNTDDGSVLDVIHFSDEGTEIVENVAVNDAGTEIVYEAESFSVYGTARSAVGEGDYIIYRDGYSDYALNYNNGTLGRQSVSIANDNVTSENDTVVWTFTAVTGGYRLSYAVGNTTYYLRNNNGSLATTTSVNEASTWSYSNNRLSTGTGTGTRYLQYNNNNFSLSNQTNNATIYLAKIAEPATITIHYVKESGEDIIPSTTLADSTSSGVTAITDIVQPLAGYTYHNTYLNSTSGTQIVPELRGAGGGSWEYQVYGQHEYTQFTSDTDIYVVYGDAYGSSGGGSGGGGGGDEPSIGVPSAGKSVTPNTDGTFTLNLSITGEADTGTESHGANIVLILDTSNSMNTSVTGGGTRFSNAVSAAQNVSNNLMRLNTEDNPDLVEMCLVTFNKDLTTSSWYSSAGTADAQGIYPEGSFNRLIADAARNSGTNWEGALQTAITAANGHQDGDATYIIFLTDGNPSTNATKTSRYDNEANATTTSPYYYRISDNYMSATDEARQIVQNGWNFYSIGMYGNVDVLNYLTNFAYYGRSVNQTENKDTKGTYYYPAAETSALIQALNDIADVISNSLALAGVDIQDGIAQDVTHTALTANIGAGKLGGLTYKKSGGTSSGYTVTVDSSGAATFKFGSDTVPGSITTINYKKVVDGNPPTEQDASAEVYAAAYNGITYYMPIATLSNDGDFEWDLGPLGTLENNATYTVSFEVWPDQDAYDYVTNLNNGIDGVTWDEGSQDPVYMPDGTTVAYYRNGVSQYPNIVKYPNGTFAAMSNTYQTADYYVASTEESGGTTTTTYEKGVPIALDIPDPMVLTGSNFQVRKSWSDSLDPSQLKKLIEDAAAQGEIYGVTLNLLEDGEFYKAYTFTPVLNESTGEYEWPAKTINIAPALLTSNYPGGGSYRTVTIDGVQYYVLNDGHEYVLEETKTDSHFEFNTITYHPALVNGVLKNVSFQVDDDGKIVSGSTASVVGNVPLVTFEGENTLRGGINIYKKVVDEDDIEVEDNTDVFDAEVTLTVPMKDGVPDFSHVENYYDDDEETVLIPSVAWYRYYDEENNVIYDDALIDAGILEDSGETSEYGRIGQGENYDGGGWFYLDFDDTTGTVTGTVKITSQYTLRFTNMAAGTTYDLTETGTLGMQPSYEFWHDNAQSDEKIVIGNAENNIRVTNKIINRKVIVYKTDSESTPKPLSDAVFTINNETLTSGEDGYTQVIELPVSDTAYDLTETAPPDGYNQLTSAVKVTVSSRGVTYIQAEYDGGAPQTAQKDANGNYVVWVRNSTGYELPHTGGPGTFLYTLGGIALIMVSALMYGFRMRRRERRLN